METFDSYLWQTIEAKQKFIAQVMTSKSPVRSCEDVDETALSYAEIKALCAGNPLIAEKMNLDIDVARLRMLKADYQSQKYRLEDDLLKHYPKQITAVNELICGYDKDIVLYKKHKEQAVDIQQTVGGSASVSSKFAGMTICGTRYTEKEPAAKALLEACKTLGDEPNAQIGEYMGFETSLKFDSFSKNFILSLKGNITHNVELGTDAFGNITRINNALSTLPDKLANAQDNLTRIHAQQQAAQDELAKPFTLADELNAKELKLTEINLQLNIGGDGEVADEVDVDDARPDDEVVDISDRDDREDIAV